MQTFIHARLALLAFGLAAAVALSGCSGDATPAESGKQGGAVASAAKPRAVKSDTDGMVAAVSSSGKPGAPVELKFDLASKPELGKPLEVSVAVVPRGEGISQLRVVFQSNEAVEVQSGSEMAVQNRPADGVALTHTVTVVPRRDGVYYLGAVALVDGAGGSVARSFAIPIIVGDPVEAERAIAEKPAQGVMSKGEGGEKVISLPASPTP
jgi:FAD/FMN-containing dehydrogenase